jgi:hypothetical protein
MDGGPAPHATLLIFSPECFLGVLFPSSSSDLPSKPI